MKTKSLPLAGALLLAGCGLQPVQPWQRAEMAWDRGLVEEGAIRGHTYQSKEAAIGGPALGGGGCGCN